MSKRFREFTEDGAVFLMEATEERPGRYIEAIVATGDQLNLNSRVYPSPVLRDAVERAKANLHRSLSQGRYGLLGEADHPPTGRPRFLETIVKWEEISYEDVTKQVRARGRLIETSAGRDAITIMEAGVLPGVSLRGTGESEFVKDGSRGEIEKVTYLELTGIDIVFGQSFPDAAVTVLEHDESEEGEVSEVTETPETAAVDETEEQDAGTETETETAETTEHDDDSAADASDDIEATADEQTVDIQNGDSEGEPAMSDLVVENEVKDKKATPANGEVVTEDKVVDAKLAQELLEQTKAREAAEKQLAEQRAAEEAARKALAEKEAAEEATRKQLEEAKTELARIERERAIAQAIQEQTTELPYQGNVRAQFIKSVQEAAARLQSADDVKALVEAKRSEYDAIVAEARVAGMGFGKGVGVQVLGPVFERETGFPEFAEMAFTFSEQLHNHGRGQMRDFRKAVTPAELLTRQYLEAFDKAYRTQLAEESQAFKHWQEAELTTDLNLPYSVARAIVAEAVPDLVAANVFDFGMIETSPTRIYFESYANESATVPAITDEAASSDEGKWIQLAHKRITPGSVVVEADGGGTVYDEYDDYLIDYANGRLYTIPAANGGSIGDSTALDVTYTYRKIREGENAAIQRGKGQLAYQTIEVEPDRLSVLISGEAITFSRTQLNWDAVTRSIAMLIREVREDIDVGCFRRGIAAAVISGNNGGTWKSSGDDADTLDDLVEKLGVAKVAVENDHYMPAAFLMSKTNADRLSNWTGLTRQGFPDAQLGAAGFTQMTVKGLPVYSSVHMPDAIILAAHRELVQHRVLSSNPMRLDGPHQARSSDSLVAGQEWFVEEYNWTGSLINEKGGYVRVA